MCCYNSRLKLVPSNTDHNTAFPPGVSKHFPNTNLFSELIYVLPQITTGATWDKGLMRRRGVAIGEEFRGKGVNIHLGPSVGALGRKPRGGRSRTPYLFFF